MVDSIIRQKEMYKEMASKAGGKPIDGSENVDANINEAGDNYQQLYLELQNDFNTYKREKRQLDRELNMELENTKRELTQERIKCGRLDADLNLANERIKMAQQDCAAARKDLEHQRISNEKHTQNLMDLQVKLSSSMQDLLREKELCQRLSVHEASLTSENSQLKAGVSRLTEEVATLKQEKRRIDDLLFGMQRMHNEIEHTETEAKRQLTSQIE